MKQKKNIIVFSKIGCSIGLVITFAQDQDYLIVYMPKCLKLRAEFNVITKCKTRRFSLVLVKRNTVLSWPWCSNNIVDLVLENTVTRLRLQEWFYGTLDLLMTTKLCMCYKLTHIIYIWSPISLLPTKPVTACVANLLCYRGRGQAARVDGFR